MTSDAQCTRDKDQNPETHLDSERVKAGMDRAKRQGKAVGRQAITADTAVASRRLSDCNAAKPYGVSLSTIQRTHVRLQSETGDQECPHNPS